VSGDVSFAPRRRTIRRGWGGLAGLGFPGLLIVIALSVGFRQGGGPSDLAASFLGALLFLVAAPTAWLFAFPFIEVTRFTVISVGVLTSAVLWYITGRAIADRSPSWRLWLRRYATVCVLWTAATLAIFAVLASLE
jgi:hypothetical protein